MHPNAMLCQCKKNTARSKIFSSIDHFGDIEYIKPIFISEGKYEFENMWLSVIKIWPPDVSLNLYGHFTASLKDNA